ncbi:alpha/beta fold hydrolase [Alphaproteobacteria bacterium]|nr:alpha/beta fold hydrolase [Alphaproteobacteria bacterium]
MSAKIEHVILDVLGIPTFVARAGEGRPVVLIHGGSPGACTSVNWKLNIVPLAEAGFEVHAYDQPGFGHSGIPDDHSMEFRVAHAAAFIQTAKLDRPHLIGNSMGAYIAARIALEKPPVGNLVLISSTTLAPSGSSASQKTAEAHTKVLRSFEPSFENMRALTQGTLFHQDLVTDELVRERFEMSIGPRFDAMVKRQGMPRARSITDELHRITARTLVMWGANDGGATLERALLLVEALPDAELHVFKNCAHWVQWDHADRFNRLVGDFLLHDG